MPELPEVEVVRRGLADHVIGARITRVTITGARVARRHVPGPADLAARVSGTQVVAARRRGKYLWLDLRGEDDPQALVIHLGMSGQLLVQAPDAPAPKHLHARFKLSDGRELRFVDQRTFGGLALTPLVPSRHDGLLVPEPVAHIAPDLLEAAYDERRVVRALRARRSAVKRALLDQSLVSGIGNIYADEGLWRAGIHGQRYADQLTKPALARLLGHTRDVMTDALAAGGTSFDSLYVNVNGNSGYFERSLGAYGRAGRPCLRCGRLMRREPFMNRSSYSCPRCQPRPKYPAP
ncbi:MAG: bifunctional DNA-formamidopyrimidine glycosylase/DNA-(apurinic or apyrimidinic site) lyase [Micrococcales bacterium]|nr:bifunctional DNA-formamidopyrimidine glycosylase/DNA-(apurinic or apyrimidinic site) lyase [Micrococcales bacterium]